MKLNAYTDISRISTQNVVVDNLETSWKLNIVPPSYDYKFTSSKQTISPTRKQ